MNSRSRIAAAAKGPIFVKRFLALGRCLVSGFVCDLFHLVNSGAHVMSSTDPKMKTALPEAIGGRIPRWTGSEPG